MYKGWNSSGETTKAYRSIITLMMYEALQVQSSNGSKTINHFEKLVK